MNTRIFLPALFGLLAISIYLGAPQAAEPQLAQGQTAPEFSLPALEGNTVALAQYRGKFVVVHFAATWCPFCNAEAPNLEGLYRKYKDRNVQVLIIDVKEPKELVVKTARKFNFTFPVLLDADGTTATRYAPPANVLPDLARDEVMIASNLIIDKQGKIRFFSVLDTKGFDAKLIALQAQLDKLLAEK